MPSHPSELPASAPTPPDGWLDEGKLSEYVDGRWVRKPDLGRFDTSMTIQAVLNLLLPFEDLLGGQLLWGWHMMAVPDLLRPDVMMSFPRFTIFQGYLVAPAFLTVDTRVKDETVSALAQKCQRKYHPFGTPYCWIVDIEAKTGYECHRGSHQAVPKDTLTAGPDVNLTVQEIFDRVKRFDSS